MLATLNELVVGAKLERAPQTELQPLLLPKHALNLQDTLTTLKRSHLKDKKRPMKYFNRGGLTFVRFTTARSENSRCSGFRAKSFPRSPILKVLIKFFLY